MAIRLSGWRVMGYVRWTKALVPAALVLTIAALFVQPPVQAASGIPAKADPALYMQANANWTSPDMPAAGQGTLAAWVTDGGRLVTSEWVLWKAAIQGNYVQLAPMFPVVPSALNV